MISLCLGEPVVGIRTSLAKGMIVVSPKNIRGSSLLS